MKAPPPLDLAETCPACGLRHADVASGKRCPSCGCVKSAYQQTKPWLASTVRP